MAISRDFSPRNKNIDEIIDMMITTQEDNGVETHMRQAMFDPVTNERINKFQRNRLEQRGVDLSAYDNSACAGCSKSCSKKDEKPISNIERGVFVYNENDLIDESDEGYICEYCTKIRFDGKYLPEVCDICEDCETCMEYMNNECDGCEYSHVYNGMSYSAASGEESVQTMSPEDQLLFDEIQYESEPRVRYPNGKFTIMNYE